MRILFFTISGKTNPVHIIIIPGMIRNMSERYLAFRIEFMYEAHYMMISYRPERCGIWHCYGISRGL
jgi:hypothetical protein